MRRKRVKVKTCQITVGEYHAYALCGRPARFKTPGDLLHKDGLYVCGIHARALAKRKRDPLYCKPMEEFYDPEQCPFEIKGFFEEFLDPETGKMIGIRSVQKPTRKLGSDGMIHIELTEEMWLKKGKNMVIVKASKERPIKAIAMIQILCGRLRYNIEAEKAGTFYPQNPDKVIAPKRKKS